MELKFMNHRHSKASQAPYVQRDIKQIPYSSRQNIQGFTVIYYQPEVTIS